MIYHNILNDARMKSLSLQKHEILGSELFTDNRVLEALQKYREEYESSPAFRFSPGGNSNLYFSDKHILTGRELRREVLSLALLPVLKEIKKHPKAKPIPNFVVQKYRFFLFPILLFVWMRNLFQKDKIHTLRTSFAELKFFDKISGFFWPSGVNLYDLLGRWYPAFHAHSTGYIPLYLADNLDSIIQRRVEAKEIRGIGRLFVDRLNNFFGLAPVVSIPRDKVNLDSKFISQDELGRKILVERIYSDIIKNLKKNPKNKFLIIDFAGGNGNLLEILLHKIYSLEKADNFYKELRDNIKYLVVDVSEKQIAFGQKRFKALFDSCNDTSKEKVVFIKADIMDIFSDENFAYIKKYFGEEFVFNSSYIGMSAYMLGAIYNPKNSDKLKKFAELINKRCKRFYAVDFSSPMWRLDDFLEDTGEWGRLYLKLVHGCTTYIDAGYNEREKHKLSKVIKKVHTVSSLATHYLTVWPSKNGHSSGYTVLEDQIVEKPGILSFAMCLQRLNNSVKYKSKVLLGVTYDLGAISNEHRAWTLIPGFMVDFIVVENSNI